MAKTLKTFTANQVEEYDPSEARFEMACAGDWLRQAEYCPDQSAETDDDDWRF